MLRIKDPLRVSCTFFKFEFDLIPYDIAGVCLELYRPTLFKRMLNLKWNLKEPSSTSCMILKVFLNLFY